MQRPKFNRFKLDEYFSFASANSKPEVVLQGQCFNFTNCAHRVRLVEDPDRLEENSIKLNPKPAQAQTKLSQFIYISQNS